MSDTIHCPETQDLIITHMLNYVPKLGWTLESLRQGVIDAGYKEGDEYRAFQGNTDKVLEHYLSMIDRQMTARLGEVDLLSMRVKDRVATAVMVRLRLLEKNKEAVRQSLRYLRHPTRTSLALKGLYIRLMPFGTRQEIRRRILIFIQNVLFWPGLIRQRYFIGWMITRKIVLKPELI